jgi:glycosyltransferase involved in cell wall biosynthesis
MSRGGEEAGTDGCDVSVVIPCFRSGATIERAVGSVVAQTCPPREVILVDDASGDGSLARLHELGSRHPDLVRVVELGANRGASGARNAGWDRAKGSLVAFLDADDSWHPRKLALQAAFMTDEPEVGLTGTGSRLIDLSATADGPGPGASHFGPVTATEVTTTTVTAKALRRSNAFLTSSTMIRRTLPLRFPEWRTGEDYGLWLWVVLGGHGAAVLDAELAYRHKPPYGAGGVSGQLWRMERGELRALRDVRRRRLLGRAAFLEAATWSLAKFGRRLAVVGARRLRPGR